MAWLKRNVALGPAHRLSAFRKIAMGTWRTAGDPSVYGALDLDVTRAQAYLDRLRAKHGKRLTMTHFVGKAVAEVLSRHPEINSLRRGSALYPRKTVDIFFQVATDPQGNDLSGAVIREADRKGIVTIGRELAESARRVREHGDPEFRRMKGLMNWLPTSLVKYAIAFSEWLTFGLNLWTPLLGVPRDAFGSAMVTSIGPLDLDEAFAPLVPYSRVPLVLAVGTVRERVIARDGKPAVAPMLRLCATFDHRYIDGVHGAKMVKTLRAIFADPEAELGPPEAI